MSQRANIRMVNSHVVKDYVEYKKDKLEHGFLKPEYPFKYLGLCFAALHTSIFSSL